MMTTNTVGENEFTNQKMDDQVKEETDLVQKPIVDRTETEIDQKFSRKSQDQENKIPEPQDGEMKTTNTEHNLHRKAHFLPEGPKRPSAKG